MLESGSPPHGQHTKRAALPDNSGTQARHRRINTWPFLVAEQSDGSAVVQPDSGSQGELRSEFVFVS